MNYQNLFKIAIRAIAANKMRSFLTALGIIIGIAAVNSSGQWIYGNNNTQSSIYGVNQDYLSIRQLKVADGEMFTDTDIKAASKVCILGQTVVDYLFPDGSDPIGKVVRFNSIPFRVIGVLKKKGYNSMGMDQDDLVLAPYTLVYRSV